MNSTGRPALLLERIRFRMQDVSIYPFLASFPFLYYPKIHDGDTQPWILITAIIALFTFRTRRFLRAGDTPLLLLVFLGIAVFALRNQSLFELIRYSNTFLTFVIFWILYRRGCGEFLPLAIKWTVVVWFLVGLHQYYSVQSGMAVDFSGRYVAGRSGVPGLTAEPSFYGGLSVVQLMFLLGGDYRRNFPFILMSLSSVVFSGSLLAMLLLLFPLLKILLSTRWGLFLAVFLLSVAALAILALGLPARLEDLISLGLNLEGFLLDPSINYRAGHLYYTLYETLPDSLIWLNSVDFQGQYNKFARDSTIFIETNSNYILPAMGELVYRSGILGVLLIMFILFEAQRTSRSIANKAIKIAFVSSCLLNPIHISSLFLLSYAMKKER